MTVINLNEWKTKRKKLNPSETFLLSIGRYRHFCTKSPVVIWLEPVAGVATCPVCGCEVKETE